MSKNKFIKLHSKEDNSVIIARISKISLVTTDNDYSGKMTTVYFDDENIDSITVNETPEKIYQNIVELDNTDFLKLHSSDDNAVMIVNTEIISVISQSEEDGKNVTTMYFNNESIESASFNESPERIYKMMEITNNDVVVTTDNNETK